MKRRATLALAALLLFTACAGDKYPYTPQFVGTDAIAIDALGAPPAVGSPKYNAEITSIIARQKKLNSAQKQSIIAEDHITPSMLTLPVLGKKYTEESYPKLYQLLRFAASDAWRIADAHQEYWNSPRPWYADDRVDLLVKRITRPGYPSGHTTTNTVLAYILTDLYPEKRSALFARATEIGNHRVDAGAHFPHDVEGGKRMASLIYAQMKLSDEYQEMLSAARAEIRDHATPLRRGRVAGCAAAHCPAMPLHP